MIVFAAFEREKGSIGYTRTRIVETVNRLKIHTGRKWSVNTGIIADSLKTFAESYRSAEATAAIVQSLGATTTINFYEDWYMHMLLLRESRTDLHSYMIQSLLPIIENKESINTLSEYLTFGENLKVTAEHLHIHVNTLKYRLQRISELLDCDLNDPNVRFKLRMVITIYRYLQNN